MNVLRLLAGILVLASCGSQDENLPEHLQALAKDIRPKVEPLPPAKPLEGFKYQAANLPDPFAPHQAGRQKAK